MKVNLSRKIASSMIVIFLLLSFGIYGQKIGETYFSYPDRNFEVQINDTCIFFRLCHMHVGRDPGKYYHYRIKNDTLQIIEKDEYGNNHIFIKKRKYLYWVDETDNKFQSECGLVFKKYNLSFKIKVWYLNKTTSRARYARRFEKKQRNKGRIIFHKRCNSPLPNKGDTFF